MSCCWCRSLFKRPWHASQSAPLPRSFRTVVLLSFVSYFFGDQRNSKYHRPSDTIFSFIREREREWSSSFVNFSFPSRRTFSRPKFVNVSTMVRRIQSSETWFPPTLDPDKHGLPLGRVQSRVHRDVVGVVCRHVSDVVLRVLRQGPIL